MTTRPAQSDLLRRLSGGYFQVAAFLGWAVAFLQISALGVSSLPTIRKSLGLATPVMLVALAYLLALVRILGDRAKACADRILRKLELLDGLGREVPPRELADLQSDASPLVIWLGKRAEASTPYFASSLPPSPARLVANTYESAWWTSRLAHRMVLLELLRFTVLLAASFLVFRAATLEKPGLHVSVNLIELATAAVLFLLTQGPLRRILEFHSLAEGARKTIAVCEQLAARKTPILEAQALEVVGEYQLTRKGSPLVPRLLWRFRRKRLNALWGQVESTTRFV